MLKLLIYKGIIIIMFIFNNILELVDNFFSSVYIKLKKEKINFEISKEGSFDESPPFSFFIDHVLDMKSYYYEYESSLYKNDFFNNFIKSIVIDKKKAINGYIRFMKFSKEEADEYKNEKLKKCNFFTRFFVRFYVVLKDIKDVDETFLIMNYKNKNIKYLLFMNIALYENIDYKPVKIIEHDPYIIPIKENLDNESIRLIKIACKKLVILFKKSVGIKTR